MSKNRFIGGSRYGGLRENEICQMLEEEDEVILDEDIDSDICDEPGPADLVFGRPRRGARNDDGDDEEIDSGAEAADDLDSSSEEEDSTEPEPQEPPTTPTIVQEDDPAASRLTRSASTTSTTSTTSAEIVEPVPSTTGQTEDRMEVSETPSSR